MNNKVEFPTDVDRDIYSRRTRRRLAEHFMEIAVSIEKCCEGLRHQTSSRTSSSSPTMFGEGKSAGKTCKGGRVLIARARLTVTPVTLPTCCYPRRAGFFFVWAFVLFFCGNLFFCCKVASSVCVYFFFRGIMAYWGVEEKGRHLMNNKILQKYSFELICW